MNIYIGADHRAFDLKEQLVAWLVQQGREVEDLNKNNNPDDDYPDVAKSVAEKVGENTDNFGILLCGSGAGVSVAANKVKGVRSALMHNPNQVEIARADDDINVLALGADFITLEEAKKAISVFLATPFSGEARHVRRLEKISQLES